MEIWFAGAVATFLIGLWKLTQLAQSLLGTRATNMKKVGLHYSPMRGNYSAEAPPTALGLGLMTFYVLAIAPLFSWLSVLSFAYSFLTIRSAEASKPERIREITYRISNVSLSESEMKALMAEVETLLLGADANERPDEANTRVLESDPWFSRLTLSLRSKTYEWEGHSEDYTSSSTTLGQYKIEADLRVFFRATRDESQSAGRPDEVAILDGVVMETDLRQRAKGSYFGESRIDDRIAELKKLTEWYEIKNPDMRCFVLSRHPEIVSTQDFRRFLRGETERLKGAVIKAGTYAEEVGYDFTEDEDGYDFVTRERDADGNAIHKREVFEDGVFVARVGATIDEVSRSKKFIATYAEWLGEKKAA